MRSFLNFVRGKKKPEKEEQRDIPFKRASEHNVLGKMSDDYGAGPMLDHLKANTKKFKIKSVPHDKVHSSQDNVHLTKSHGFTRAPKDFDEFDGLHDHPVAIEHKGNYYLRDGHHRASSAHAKGKKSSTMHVYHASDADVNNWHRDGNKEISDANKQYGDSMPLMKK